MSSVLGALHLKFSKATGLWTAKETCVYIGEPMGMQGKQRTAIWVKFLHQEERLSRYAATHSRHHLNVKAFSLTLIVFMSLVMLGKIT